MKRISFVLLGALLISTNASVTAASDADIKAAVEARQAHMKGYGKNMAVLGGMAQGKIAYDADAATVAANKLLELTKQDQSTFWPMGSDNAVYEKTRALPGLWQEGSTAASDGKALSEAVTTMAEVAGSGVEGIQANMRSLGGACSACHRKYRAPEK